MDKRGLNSEQLLNRGCFGERARWDGTACRARAPPAQPCSASHFTIASFTVQVHTMYNLVLKLNTLLTSLEMAWLFFEFISALNKIKILLIFLQSSERLQKIKIK